MLTREGEEKKEEDVKIIPSIMPFVTSFTSSSSSSSMTLTVTSSSSYDTVSSFIDTSVDEDPDNQNRSNNNNNNGCGKRPRSHHRVSFPSNCCIRSNNNGSTNNNNSSSGNGNGNEYFLIKIRDTIHVSEYTSEERRACWYNIDDLRAFKRDRRETARRIDMGWMLLPSASLSTSSSTSSSTSTKNSQLGGEDDNKDIYCARGVENCTEEISRIRYRTIADGWRSVLNLQESHYHNQKMIMMVTEQQQQQRIRKQQDKEQQPSATTNTTMGWYYYGNYGINNNYNNISNTHRSKSSLCCPYELAREYGVPSSVSLKIARDRAIVDERQVLGELSRC